MLVPFMLHRAKPIRFASHTRFLCRSGLLTIIEIWHLTSQKEESAALLRDGHSLSMVGTKSSRISRSSFSLEQNWGHSFPDLSLQ
jgi:hypothetical protein